MHDFTLLMAVYAHDDEGFVRSAYASATTGQDLPPTSVVVVQDGPVPRGIAAWLEEISASDAVSVVRLEHNRGLAAALNAGLAQVPTEIVARADADDICLPERFALQIPLIESGFDLVGSAIAEFSDDPAHPGTVRSVLTTQAEIEQQARLESPFHHPSVVFRKQAVLDVGGYPELRQMEDYLLWAKMLGNGARVANIDQVLVHYRVGAGAFQRRGGKILAQSESRLQKEFLATGFINHWQYARNWILRGPVYRYMPARLRRFLYHLWIQVVLPRQSTLSERELNAHF